ncbi:MAG: MATE family efflux transporter, partial [Clostridia bacterium]|nr:MATE family efflux transporter [Clostridia bacterium]
EHGLKLFSLAFTLCGFNIYGSAFFTALNNGFISAVISFMRTFVFQAAIVIILPIFFKTDGIWFSLIVSEMLAFIVAAALVFIKNKDYNYM